MNHICKRCGNEFPLKKLMKTNGRCPNCGTEISVLEYCAVRPITNLWHLFFAAPWSIKILGSVFIAISVFLAFSSLVFFSLVVFRYNSLFSVYCVLWTLFIYILGRITEIFFKGLLRFVILGGLILMPFILFDNECIIAISLLLCIPLKLMEIFFKGLLRFLILGGGLILMPLVLCLVVYSAIKTVVITGSVDWSLVVCSMFLTFLTIINFLPSSLRWALECYNKKRVFVIASRCNLEAAKILPNKNIPPRRIVILSVFLLVGLITLLFLLTVRCD